MTAVALPFAPQLQTQNPGGGGGVSGTGIPGVFIVTLAPFNAVADGVANDAGPIAAADAAALAVGGIVYFPSVNPAGGKAIYRSNTPLVVQAPSNWIGDSGAQSGLAGPVIRAGAAMTTLLQVRSTFGASAAQDAPGACFRGLTFDGNNIVTQGVIQEIGSYATTFENCEAINTLAADGWQRAGRPLPLVLGAIVLGGGAPGGVTITQPDPNNGFGSNLQAGLFNIVLKVQGGGTTYVVSTDGGVTYGTIQQPIGLNSNIFIPDANPAKAGYPSGLVAHFPVQAYANNNTYTQPTTIQVADQGATAALNTGNKYINCGATNGGTVFLTAGATGAGNFVPTNVRTVVIAGTVSIAAGSPVVTGAGTGLLATGAVEGSMLSIAGVAYPLAGVDNDLRAYIAPGSEPTVTLNAQEFAISVGMPWRETGGTESNNAELTSFRKNAWPHGMRVGGLHGTANIKPRFDQSAFQVAMLIGSTQIPTESDSIIAADFEGTSTAYVATNCQGVSFLEFSHLTPYPLGPGTWWVIHKGSQVTQNAVSNVPVNTLVIPATSFNFASAGLTIPGPDIGPALGSGNTSLVNVTSSAPFTLTGAPTVGAPNGQEKEGAYIELTNVGNWPLILQDDAIAGTNLFLEGPKLIWGTNESIRLRRHAARWFQVGPIAPVYASNVGGNRGFVDNAARLQALATVSLYDLDTFNSSIAAGVAFKFDVIAMARGGLDVAVWSDCLLICDTADNVLAPRIPTPFQTAGAAATWTLAFLITGHFLHINFTADGSVNNVFVVLKGLPLSPPTAF
jgi:hypothetical protein